jgi:PAS domain S-box-containing protein
VELKKRGILIVEDDEIFRRFLKDHLSGLPGLEVVGEAEDGRKALEQAEALHPDLVIMDGRMPKLNGFKASRLLLEKMPHLRILILGVFDNLKDKQAAKECGACGYVQKLNVLEDLHPAIRAAFRPNRDRGKSPKKRTGQIKKARRPEAREVIVDVAEQERAGDTVRLAEERIRFLLTSASAAVYSSRAESPHPATFVSSSIQQMTGYEAAKFIARPGFWYDCLHPEDRPKVAQEVPKLFKKDFHSYEYRFQCKNGEYIWIRDEMTLVRDEKSRPLEIIGLCTDITRRKQAEEQVRLDEARLQSLYNISQYKPKDMRDLWDFALEEATNLTGSKVGWLGAYRPDRQTLKVITWSKEVRKDDRIKNRPLEFPIEKGGIWAEAIRSGQPLIINDYKARDPRKKGTPPGHIELVRLLAMPIVSEDKTVYLIVAANKEKDYDATDVRQLTLLLDPVLKIVERQRAEEALKRSEEKYRELVENLNDVLYTIKADGTITYVSPTIQTVLGYTPAELIGTDFALLVFPDDLDRIRRAFEDILRGRLYPSEYRIFAKNGEVRWIRTSSRPVTEAGRVAGLQGVLTDITERKQAEEALQKSEKKFRALIEHSQDAVTMIAADGTVLYDSPSLLQVLGYAPSERLGKKVFDFAHPDDRSDMMLGFARFALQRGATMSYQGRFTHKDGTSRWIEGVRANLLHEPLVQAIVVNYRDITERQRAEEALRESEERFRSLFENSTIGIYRTTPDGRILLANPALVRMLGHGSLEELKQRNLEREGFTPDFPRSRFHLLIEKKGEVRGLKSAWTKADGTVIYVRESAKAIRQAGGEILYYEGTVEDITERRRAEEALRQSEEQYRTLVESLNEVIISLDLEGKFDYVSPAVERITKYKVSELIGQPFGRFVHPDDLSDLTYRFSEGMKGETRPYVFRVLDKDGEIKFMRTHGRPIMKGGKPIGLTGLLEDVTKRKRAEEALKRSEERFKRLFTFAPDAYFLLDLQGRLLDSNNAAQVLTGHTNEEVVGRTFIDLRFLPPSQKEKAFALLEKNVRGLSTGPEEMALSGRDGAEIQVEIRTFPIKIEGEIQILWIARDIAERKALENEAEKRMTELEEFYKMAINRELRMIELKNDIERLSAELASFTGGLEKRA